MRKLFTSLCVAVLAAVATSTAWAQTTIYQKTETKLTAEDLTNGKFITVQAVDRNNSGFFGGAGPCSPSFQNNGSTVYEIVKAEGESTVSFKHVSTGKYLKTPTGNNNLEFVDNADEAAKMTVAKADGTDGKQNAANHRNNLLDGTDLNFLYRFYVGNFILNCQGTNTNAGWRGGQGGWTTFYIWEVQQGAPVNVTVRYCYDGQEVKSETKVLVDILPYNQQGIAAPAYYGVTASTNDDLTANPTEGATITFNYTLNESEPFPFQFYSQAAATNKWYTLALRGNRLTKYNGTPDANSFDVAAGEASGEDYHFQFVGNPLQGFKVYNHAGGLDKALSLSNKGVDNAKFNLNPESEEVSFWVRKKDDAYFFLVDGTSNNYVNERDRKLSTWNNAAAYNNKDAGSTLVITEVNEAEVWAAKFNAEKAALGPYLKGSFSFFNESAYNEALTSLPEVNDEASYNAALMALDQAATTAIQPTNGSLVSIAPLHNVTGEANAKALSGKLAADGKHLTTIPATEAATKLSTLFYYNEGKLTCLDNGQVIGLDGEAITADGYTGSEVAFSLSPNGAYNIAFGQKALVAESTSDATSEGEVSAAQEEGWAATDFQVMKINTIPLTIHASGYATFFTPFPVTVAEGYTAYKAAKSQDGNSLQLEELTGAIPANTAFIVKGEAGTVCTLTLAESGDADVSNNALTGAATSQDAPANTLALLKPSETPKFAKLGEGVKMIAFKAFFVDSAAAPTAQSLPFSFGALTAIAAPAFQSLGTTAPIYDLSGRRVAQPVKGGLYLQAGKKIVAQ